MPVAGQLGLRVIVLSRDWLLRQSRSMTYYNSGCSPLFAGILYCNLLGLLGGTGCSHLAGLHIEGMRLHSRQHPEQGFGIDCSSGTAIDRSHHTAGSSGRVGRIELQAERSLRPGGKRLAAG